MHEQKRPSEMPKVPFLDLVTPHRQLEDELLNVVRTALHSGGFVGGPMVQEFEREFARFCDVPRAIGVSSGTDALRFALTASGVNPGDVVVTVANTFIATTEAISQAGAVPHFVDVDNRTLTMDPAKLRAYLEQECVTDASGKTVTKTGQRVSAVVPVHLFGQIADMDPILELAGRYGLIVVEDACQAHGAEYYSAKDGRWKKAGSIGDAAAFSFYPGKNLGACGEAGAITTKDDRIAKTCEMLREHGQSKKYHHEMEGYNGRLDAIQAGMLTVKLRHLAAWNERRRERAKAFDDLLADGGDLIGLPHVPEWSRPVFHLYVVRVADRERLQNELAAVGIGTGIHYPVPLHTSKVYASLGYRTGDLPVTEQAAGEILSLPMFPTLTEDEQRRVAEALLASVGMSRTLTAK